jgi:hypothetical protein
MMLYRWVGASDILYRVHLQGEVIGVISTMLDPEDIGTTIPSKRRELLAERQCHISKDSILSNIADNLRSRITCPLIAVAMMQQLCFDVNCML